MATSIADRTETSWQENKSIADTNLHMLDHEILSDALFLVGQNKSPVRAHRFMLVSRSPVFYAMFCGPLAEEKGGIVVPDIEPATFKTFLRYVYTDECALSGDNVTSLMYAAEKYQTVDLIRKCTEFLKDNLGIDNVCAVLQQAIAFDNVELVEKCLGYIAQHDEVVLKSEQVKQLDRCALQKIVELDSLKMAEEDIYTACVSWGKHQCETDGKDATDQNIRECLGEVLYLIRFSTMPIETFTSAVSRDDILTDSEKVSVFQQYGSKSARDTKFPTSHRARPLKEINVLMKRFLTVNSTPWHHSGKADAISFTCSHNAWLVGISLFTPIREGQIVGPLEIFDDANTVYKQTVTLTYIKSKQYEDVMFDREIKIKVGKTYTLQQTLTGGPPSFRGGDVNAEVRENDIVVKFTSSDKSKNGTDVNGGQFYRLLLCC